MHGTANYLVITASSLTVLFIAGLAGMARRWASGLGSRLDEMENRLRSLIDGISHRVQELDNVQDLQGERIATVEAIIGMRDSRLGARWIPRDRPLPADTPSTP